MTTVRRVGLGALFLDPGVSGGSETYLRSLIPALVRAHPEVTFELATTRRGADELTNEDWAGAVRVLRLRCDDDQPVRRTMQDLVAIPRLARERGWQLLHSLSNRGPRHTSVASVVTLHDVIFFDESTLGRVSTAGMRWAVRGAVAGADWVIAGSESAASDIARVLGVDLARVTAIPHGPGREPGPPAPEALVRRRFDLGSARVILCVAAKRPHKNQRLLIEALRFLPGDLHLILVGRDEGQGPKLAAQAQEAGASARVHLLEYLPDPDLEGLWSVASCAAFPTRAEGFGLPVLEAMRRGVPVACSDIPVLREVAGSAAHYFQADDARAAAAAIEMALEDRDAARLGLERAARFTWERAAAATYRVYEQALRARADERALR